MKQELIYKILSTKDENMLEEVYRILEAGTTEIDKIILSEKQKNAIDQGIRDIESGNYLSDEEANKQVEEWLKK